MHVGYAGAVEKSAFLIGLKIKIHSCPNIKKTRDFTTLFCVLFFTGGGGGGLGSRICVGLHFKFIYKK